MKIRLSDVLNATGGTLLGAFNDLDAEVQALISNSKSIDRPALFVPFIGAENDGHDFIREALDNGCVGCLTDRELPEYDPGKIYVRVDNTLEAAWKIALLWRSRLTAKLICVTGSAGKTSTTGMIASILRQRFTVFETMENHNDEHLVPGMISRIEPEHEYAVLELGLGMTSSVSKMASLISPDAMVLTNVGYAHVQKTGSIYETMKEKCGTERGVRPGGHVIINGDDPLLSSFSYTHDVIKYGNGTWNDVHADGRFTVPEKHLTYPTLAGVAVGRLVGMDDDTISAGIGSFKQEGGRMDVVDCDTFTLIDSTFNASPASMKVALDTLGEYEGRRIAVLGDMLELGDYAKVLHNEVGSYVTAEKADVLIAVGEHADDILSGVSDEKVEAYSFATPADSFETVVGCIDDCLGIGTQCTILCKGSHGSKMYELADVLRNGV